MPNSSFSTNTQIETIAENKAETVLENNGIPAKSEGADFGLVIPNTTEFVADKTIATIDQIPDISNKLDSKSAGASYGVAIPNTSSFTANKTIATTDDVADKADLTDLAPVYDSTATYAVGDIVTYEGDIYKCITEVSTAEVWDNAKWTKKDIKDLLSDKLEKDTSTTSYGQVYTKNPNGTQAMVDYTQSVLANRLVQRMSDGSIKVPTTPTSSSHATSKEYVDNNFASISVAGQEYDPSQTYNQYSTCMHNGKAYYRSSSTPTTGTWSDLGWTEFNMGQLFFVTRDLDTNKLDNKTSGATYGLAIPTTTSWTGDRTVATTDDLTSYLLKTSGSGTIISSGGSSCNLKDLIDFVNAYKNKTLITTDNINIDSNGILNINL